MNFNIKFDNCFNFINNMKDVIESDRDRWDNIYMEHSVVLAECDLMEMEIEAAHDAEMYDSIMNGNAFRKGRNRKARQNGKRNADKAKRLHKADRYHGKDRYKRIKKNNCCEILEGNIPSSKKFIDSTDEMNGSWIIMNRNKKVGRRAETLQKVTYNRKTFRDRLVSAMDAREQDYILSPDPIEELWNAYWLHRDAECRLNHKADEPLFMHRTQGAYEEAIKEWEKLTEEEYNAFLKVDDLLYSLGLDWNYFES